MPSVTQTLQRQAAVDANLACPSGAPAGALRLGDAVLRALCNDPKTQASWAALRGQQAEVAARRAARWPSASAQMDLGRGFERERAADASTTRANGTAAGLGLQMQWVLWDFGLQRSRETAAEQAMMAAAASHDQSLQQTLINVVQAYLACAEAQALLKLNRDAERFVRDLLAESMRPGKAGKPNIDPLGQKQARTASWSKILDVRRAEGQLARARGELASFMGLPVQSSLNVEAPAATLERTGFERPLSELLETAMASHPPLREAQARLAAAQAELQEAQRSDGPVVLASGALQQSRTPNLPSRADHSIGLRLEVPLNAWKDRSPRVQRAQAQLDAASAGYRAARKDLELDVWTQYQNLREQAAALRIAERFRASADDLLRAELAAFRDGDSDMFDVLDANSSRTEAASAELSSLSALNLARVRLAASLGQLAQLQLPNGLPD